MLRAGIVAGVVLLGIALYALSPWILPDAGSAERLSRREVMVGFLTLGLLAVVALGFDVRDLF